MAEDEGQIRCICGFTEDDGFTIQCEKCFVWQHAVCVDISSNDVPEVYFCDECEPRDLNVERAIDLQEQRQKEESEARKSDDRRFNKPRRRKESQDQIRIDSKKRKPKENVEAGSPPRKRARELSMGDLNNSASNLYPAPSPELERKKGRPRLHSISNGIVAVPFSRKPIAEPICRKKRTSKDSHVRFSDSFEHEYAMTILNFAEILRNRITTAAYGMIDTIFKDQYSFYHTRLPDLKKQEMIIDQRSAILSLLYDDFPPTYCNTQVSMAKPFPSGAKQNCLLSTVNIPKYSYISELFGMISTEKDLGLRHESLSIYPAVSNLESHKKLLIAPPFVYKLPLKNGDTEYWLDSREFSTLESRCVRTVCQSCSIQCPPNAVLKIVLLKSSEDIKSEGAIYSLLQGALPQLLVDGSDSELSSLDRMHICLFSLKAIQPGEEIVLQQAENVLNYPCACADTLRCDTLESVYVVDNFGRSKFGDPDIPSHKLYSDFRAREVSREKDMAAEIEKLTKQQNLGWIYDPNAAKVKISFGFEFPTGSSDESDGDDESIISIVSEVKTQPEIAEPDLAEDSKGDLEQMFQNEESNMHTRESSVEMDVQFPESPKPMEEQPTPEKIMNEPKRVSLRDFMKQQSTTFAPADSVTEDVNVDSTPAQSPSSATNPEPNVTDITATRVLMTESLLRQESSTLLESPTVADPVQQDSRELFKQSSLTDLEETTNQRNHISYGTNPIRDNRDYDVQQSYYPRPRQPRPYRESFPPRRDYPPRMAIDDRPLDEMPIRNTEIPPRINDRWEMHRGMNDPMRRYPPNTRGRGRGGMYDDRPSYYAPPPYRSHDGDYPPMRELDHDRYPPPDRPRDYPDWNRERRGRGYMRGYPPRGRGSR